MVVSATVVRAVISMFRTMLDTVTEEYKNSPGRVRVENGSEPSCGESGDQYATYDAMPDTVTEEYKNTPGRVPC
jgi:hypothetical protein